jgi:hypothetical protein
MIAVFPNRTVQLDSEGIMHLALCSQSVFSVVIAFLRTPLVPTIAIAVASVANFGGANAVDLMDSSEEMPDQIVPSFIGPAPVTPLDAFGYLGGPAHSAMSAV